MPEQLAVLLREAIADLDLLRLGGPECESEMGAKFQLDWRCAPVRSGVSRREATEAVRNCFAREGGTWRESGRTERQVLLVGRVADACRAAATTELGESERRALMWRAFGRECAQCILELVPSEGELS